MIRIGRPRAGASNTLFHRPADTPEWVAATVATLAGAALVVMVGTGITVRPPSSTAVGAVVLEAWDDTFPTPPKGASVPLPGRQHIGTAAAVTPGTITPVTQSTPGTYLPARDRCAVGHLPALLAGSATAASFAEVLGVPQGSLLVWARSLEAATLGQDTRVTNHELDDSGVAPYQSVLQAGTGVLTAPDGTPVVRCASLTPLTPPRAAASTYIGGVWDGFNPRDLVAIVADPVAIPLTPDVGVITASWPDHRNQGDTA